MAEPARSRRSTLHTLIFSVLGGAALWRFLTPRPRAARTGALSVPEADVPAHGALVLPEQRCAVVREASDFLAVDLTCTHLGCTVAATAQGFSCPCHGSRFTSTGAVLKGPASRPLARLKLDRSNGMIRVSRG
jgi:Rieske Fe-S protein